MYEIINCLDYEHGLEAAMHYIHDQWGSEQNFPTYLDTALHSSKQKGSIPQFFLLLKGSKIVGCYGLIINDLISRQDIWPWFCCVFVEPDHRGQRLLAKMIEHAQDQLAETSFSKLYLCTNHDGLYEKFGWTRMEDGYDFSGKSTRIYWLALRR